MDDEERVYLLSHADGTVDQVKLRTRMSSKTRWSGRYFATPASPDFITLYHGPYHDLSHLSASA